MKVTSYSFWIILVGTYSLFCYWGGCPFASSRDPSKLPGVWRSPGQGIDLILTFEPGGSFRYQTEVKNSWMNLFAGNVDTTGRWALDRHRLTMEFTDTPLGVALAGSSWKGQKSTFHIRRLDDSELTFSDMDLKFRRSLAPVK